MYPQGYGRRVATEALAFAIPRVVLVLKVRWWDEYLDALEATTGVVHLWIATLEAII